MQLSEQPSPVDFEEVVDEFEGFRPQVRRQVLRAADELFVRQSGDIPIVHNSCSNCWRQQLKTLLGISRLIFRARPIFIRLTLLKSCIAGGGAERAMQLSRPLIRIKSEAPKMIKQSIFVHLFEMSNSAILHPWPN